MACIFNAPGCVGPNTGPTECAYCHELAQDDDLQAMATFFPLEHVVALIKPRLLVTQAGAQRGAMPPVPLRDGGKHVNRAAVAAAAFDVDMITRSDADQNCALCSAAGCVNLALGYVKFTSKKVARLEGVPDSYTALGTRPQQERRIIQFVSSNLPGYRHVVHGSDENRLGQAPAIAAMLTYPDGTAFVVSALGSVSKGGESLKGTRWGHWLNAVKQGGVILFVDFQTDHEQRLGRAFVSSEPILGNFGVEWDAPELQVIAFVPPPPRPAARPQFAPSNANRPAAPARPGTMPGAPPSPRGFGDQPIRDAALPLPIPVLPGTTTQQVVPLTHAPKCLVATDLRRQHGLGMAIGTPKQLDAKLKRQGGYFQSGP